ncbi:MAG: helix-turn-helix transcriptional regulator, partial [Pseudomonadota bacterium]
MKLTQEIAADKLGYNSQGTVSDYINGHIPLNLPAALGFARLLEVHVSEVWDGDPELVFKSLPLEDVRDLALELNYEDQLALASLLLERA